MKGAERKANRKKENVGTKHKGKNKGSFSVVCVVDARRSSLPP